MVLRHSISRLAVGAACLSLSLSFHPLAQAQPGSARWITTWTTSNAASDQPTTFSNQTIREVVHTSIGGSAVRIRLSNTFGPRAIRFDAVAVGLQQNGASLVPHSNHEVTFGGSRPIAIPEGAEVLSDPVALKVGPEQNLTISLFTAGDTGPATGHWLALQTNYVSRAGDFSADEGGSGFSDSAGAKTATSWYFLSAVEAQSTAGANGAIVVLGDSITDGAASQLDANGRWTDYLGRRLLASHADFAVLNAGIAGNRVLTTSPCWGQNALARLGRDVLAQSGVVAVILFEGTNDIGQPDTKTLEPNPCLSRTPVTAEEIIAGYKQIIARTHARGLKIFGATILPYQGFGAWTPQGETKRVAVNQWIRTSGAFDGVIDFDAALRDPATPARMAPKYDSGDHLHPGPAGHEAMGNAVDLALFR
ncbi:MAG TPA: SGNH/GDSL hydrolase family protein [Terriglobales bacterium]|nr:SGNH/GDSL hydrolase family protein [Terriglobales bacterium]